LRSFSGYCAAFFSEPTKGKLVRTVLRRIAKISQTVENTVKRERLSRTHARYALHSPNNCSEYAVHKSEVDVVKAVK
jgi:hypothetical protein